MRAKEARAPQEPAPARIRQRLGAIEQVAERSEADKRRRLALNGSATLNRATLDFIRDGAATGDRHRLLFSAAANLAEFGCSLALAEALLSDAALDSGLSPSDVHRQIECGIDGGRR